MGVFTAVSDEEFSRWVQPAFGFSTVSALSPVEDGFQNTNYYFWGDHKKYVFTIFENTPEDYVDYYVDFVRLLAARNAPVPASLFPKISAGRWWQKKPCCISPFLPGTVLAAPGETHCYKLGRMTAHLHINSQTLSHEAGALWRGMAGHYPGQITSANDGTVAGRAPRFFTKRRSASAKILHPAASLARLSHRFASVQCLMGPG